MSGVEPAVLVGHGVMMRGSQGGDIGEPAKSSSGTEGLYVADARLLSRWVLDLNGHRFRLAGSDGGTGHRTLALLPVARRHETHGLFATRDQRLTPQGFLERLILRNLGIQNLDVELRLDAGTDFADQFAIRSDGRRFDLSGATRAPSIDESGALLLEYSHEQFTAGVRIGVSMPARVFLHDDGARFVGGTLTWILTLAPGESRVLDIAVESTHAPPGGANPAQVERSTNARPSSAASALQRQSTEDLDALCMPCPGLPHLRIPAAGLPWFLTLFGRDSLITSVLAQPERPALLPDVLRALAATQGIRHDPVHVEQPGKIVHEMRVSELAQLELVPYSRYYGTVDANALFLMGLARVRNRELLRELQPTARAAVDWLRTDGGLDAHGFIRYTPDPDGLLNQGWKDSIDAVASADGRLARGPISLCEVQGYTWRGLVDTARIARDVWEDNEWADELERIAAELRLRFRDNFWMPDHAFPALALDGDGRQVDALASNAGHLLWTGILDQQEAGQVTERLLRTDFFSGWGIRTLAAGQELFHPMSYHNGSVWPHDTMLAALGMRSYGFIGQARAVAQGLADAAGHFANRLPELFGGFSRDEFPTPISYEHAGSPQAWAAAAGLAADRVLRGAPDA